MKKFTGKQLAFAAWIIAAANMISVISIVKLYITNDFLGFWVIVSIITQLASVILQVILGFAMYREKNDNFTVFAIILFCVIDIIIPLVKNIIVNPVLSILLFIPSGVLITGLFVKKRKGNDSFVAKIWYIPSILKLICSFVSAMQLNVWIFVYALNFLLLGYWLWYWLIVRDKSVVKQEAIDGQVAFYDDLLARGVITQDEYNTKVNQLKGK